MTIAMQNRLLMHTRLNMFHLKQCVAYALFLFGQVDTILYNVY